MRRAMQAAIAVLCLVGCSDDASPGNAVSPSSSTTSVVASAPTTTAFAAALCASAGTPEQIGVVGAPRLDELSGLETDVASTDVLWAIEDSGNDPSLFALDATGAALAEIPLRADNVDWEALAAGADGTLYIGDIGDNLRSRASVTIYSVAAPDDPAVAGPLDVIATEVRYPDEPHDAEALFADPRTGDLFIVTKALDQRTLTFDRDSIVFRIPAPAGGEVTAEEVGRFEAGFLEMVTGADISTDGNTIAIRTYSSILLWDRGPDQSVADALRAEPCTIDSPPDRVGEAIAIQADGSILTTSEDASAPIWRITLP